MVIRFASILFQATFLFLFAISSHSYRDLQYRFIKSVDGLMFKTMGYNPQGIYSYTKSNLDQTINAIDTVTGKEFMTFNLPTYIGITSLSLLLPTNNETLIGCGGVVNTYTYNPNNFVENTYNDSIVMMGDIQYSHDKKYLITVPMWYFVRLRAIEVFDAASRQKLKHVPIVGTFTSLDVATKSNILATGTDNNLAILWPFPSENVYTLNKHTGPVNSVSFSYDNKYLLTGSDDTTILLWDVNTRAVLATFKAGEKVKAVQWLPNDEYFATVTANNNFMIWNPSKETWVSKTKLPEFKPNAFYDWQHFYSLFFQFYMMTTLSQLKFQLQLKLEPNFNGTLIQFDSTGKHVGIQLEKALNIQVWREI